MENVSFAVYESLQAKDERVIKRLIIALVISVALLFLSNAIWVLTLVNRSDNIENNGDITYGESESETQKSP